MESSNLLDLRHHPEELLLLHASSALDWNQQPFLNGIELIPSSNSIDEQLIDPSCSTTSHHHMVQDLAQQIHLAKIKEELSHESFLKLEQYQLSSGVKNEEQTLLYELNSYLQPSPLPSAIDGNLGLNNNALSFGMLLPSVNIPSTYLPSMETSFEGLDILASARFGRIAPCQYSEYTFFDNMNYIGLPQQLQCQAQAGFINLHQMPPSINGVIEGKRANSSSLDPLKSSQGASKKPRFESRPSLSPLKVRKEKLGDRIAALQQLVAPFGKTDTASVLMEAIGYIKFLQDQVETLSVPYMRLSNNKKLCTTEETLSVPYMRPSNNKKLCTIEEVSTTEERDDPKPDLRSRGLCLVPLSCTSYVTNDNAVWSPPNFR